MSENSVKAQKLFHLEEEEQIHYKFISANQLLVITVGKQKKVLAQYLNLNSGVMHEIGQYVHPQRLELESLHLDWEPDSQRVRMVMQTASLKIHFVQIFNHQSAHLYQINNTLTQFRAAVMASVTKPLLLTSVYDTYARTKAVWSFDWRGISSLFASYYKRFREDFDSILFKREARTSAESLSKGYFSQAEGGMLDLFTAMRKRLKNLFLFQEIEFSEKDKMDYHLLKRVILVSRTNVITCLDSDIGAVLWELELFPAQTQFEKIFLK